MISEGNYGKIKMVKIECKQSGGGVKRRSKTVQ